MSSASDKPEIEGQKDIDKAAAPPTPSPLEQELALAKEDLQAGRTASSTDPLAMTWAYENDLALEPGMDTAALDERRLGLEKSPNFYQGGTEPSTSGGSEAGNLGAGTRNEGSTEDDPSARASLGQAGAVLDEPGMHITENP